ncbi:MAG: hypothetical protein ACRBBW_04665 [Cellvibrionaceae bacterium]
MTDPLPITEDQRDCLQEVSNVAMGAAAEALASFSKVFVEMSVPQIRFIKPAELPKALASLQGGDLISGVVQEYKVGSLQAYVLTMITEPSFQDLSQQTGLPIGNDEEAIELLVKLSQTINGVGLPVFAQQFGLRDVEFVGKPKVAALHRPLAEVTLGEINQWDNVLTTEMNYHLEGHPFNCDLLLVTPDSSVAQLAPALDSLL